MPFQINPVNMVIKYFPFVIGVGVLYYIFSRFKKLEDKINNINNENIKQDEISIVDNTMKDLLKSISKSPSVEAEDTDETSEKTQKSQ